MTHMSLRPCLSSQWDCSRQKTLPWVSRPCCLGLTLAFSLTDSGTLLSLQSLKTSTGVSSSLTFHLEFFRNQISFLSPFRPYLPPPGPSLLLTMVSWAAWVLTHPLCISLMLTPPPHPPVFPCLRSTCVPSTPSEVAPCLPMYSTVSDLHSSIKQVVWPKQLPKLSSDLSSVTL